MRVRACACTDGPTRTDALAGHTHGRRRRRRHGKRGTNEPRERDDGRGWRQAARATTATVRVHGRVTDPRGKLDDGARHGRDFAERRPAAALPSSSLSSSSSLAARTYATTNRRGAPLGPVSFEPPSSSRAPPAPPPPSVRPSVQPTALRFHPPSRGKRSLHSGGRCGTVCTG